MYYFNENFEKFKKFFFKKGRSYSETNNIFEYIGLPTIRNS